jgi:4-hydroxybenzoate polyprenyltransferase
VYLGACAALGTWYLEVAAIPIAVFTLYPYLKRLTPLCHLGVGAALALSPLAGYAAAHPDLAHPGPALALAAFALAWVSGFDIIYATLDEAFDREHGVHSAVVWLGRPAALRASWALHVAAIAALAAVWWVVAPGRMTPLPFVAALACFAGAVVLLVLEQKWAEDVNLAFFKTNVWVGFAVLGLVLAARWGTGGF